MYRLSINLIAVGAVVYRIYVYTYTYIYTHTHISYEQTRIRIHNSVSAYVSFVRSRRRLYIISSLNDSATGLSKGFSEGGGGRLNADIDNGCTWPTHPLHSFSFRPESFFLLLFRERQCRRKHGRIDREISRRAFIHTYIHTRTRILNKMYLQINLLIVFWRNEIVRDWNRFFPRQFSGNFSRYTIRQIVVARVFWRVYTKCENLNL